MKGKQKFLTGPSNAPPRVLVRRMVGWAGLAGLVASILATILSVAFGWHGWLLKSAIAGGLISIAAMEVFVRFDLMRSPDVPGRSALRWRTSLLGGAGVFALFAYLFREDRRL